jgi:hypothetical protein
VGQNDSNPELEQTPVVTAGAVVEIIVALNLVAAASAFFACIQATPNATLTAAITNTLLYIVYDSFLRLRLLRPGCPLTPRIAVAAQD